MVILDYKKPAKMWLKKLCHPYFSDFSVVQPVVGPNTEVWGAYILAEGKKKKKKKGYSWMY